MKCNNAKKNEKLSFIADIHHHSVSRPVVVSIYQKRDNELYELYISEMRKSEQANIINWQSPLAALLSHNSQQCLDCNTRSNQQVTRESRNLHSRRHTDTHSMAGANMYEISVYILHGERSKNETVFPKYIKWKYTTHGEK